MRSGTCLLLALLLAPSLARAELTAGDTCKLSGALTVKLRNSVQGSIETELSRGTEVTVTEPGIHFSRILAGDVEALAPSDTLEAVCAVPRERCVLTDDIKMATERRERGGKPKVFKVKAGATVSVLERGAARSRVVVGGVIGRVNSEHLTEKCRSLEAKSPSAGGAPNSPPPATYVGPAPKGTRVAVLPFGVAPGASAIDARAFEDDLTEALQKRRGDLIGPRDPRPGAKERLLDPKAHLDASAALGSAMNVPYIVTGHLSGGGDKRVLALTVYDVKASRVVRTIRARPTYHAEDPWADVSSGFLNEVLPGGAKYNPPKQDPPDKPKPTPNTQAPAQQGAWRDGPPWYTNGLAYTSLGTGVLLATGGALTGYWASTDVEAHARTVSTDPARRELANTAMTKGIIADSLYATAIVAGVASVVFFVTGVDWDGV